jgi:RNA polymerase sigma-70 factor (ECF subfamily)
MTEDQIIDKIRNGEKEMYGLIVRKYNQRLYRVARAIVRNEAEVEDILQDTYLKVYLALPKFERRSRFSTWITKILINNANESLRKKSKEKVKDISHNMAEPKAAEKNHSLETEFSNKELKLILEEAIDRLPNNLRMVYIMREVEGLNVSETSECLGISEENVKTRLHRARTFLKDELYRRTKGDIDLFRFGAERCDRMVVSVMMQVNGMN